MSYNRKTCTCHINVKALMNAFASFIQGPWNPAGWKAPGVWKGLMTGWRCYYPPTETPVVCRAECEFPACSTHGISSFCCFRKSPWEWPTPGSRRRGAQRTTITASQHRLRLTIWPDAILSTFHLILTMPAWFYISQVRKMRHMESDLIECKVF